MSFWTVSTICDFFYIKMVYFRNWMSVIRSAWDGEPTQRGNIRKS